LWLAISVPLLFVFKPIEATQEHAATASAPDKERKPMFWTDPMVPGSRFDHGGKSPFMDMDLVPVYETDPSIISMTESEASNLSVRTIKVSRRRLSDSIRTLATIAYDERNVQDVTVRVNARISAYYYPIHEGYLVMKGQPLFELQSPEIYQYLGDYLNLVSNSERLAAVSTNTAHVMAQSRTSLSWRGIPAETVDEVVKTGKATDRFVVRSPATGIILKRFVEQDSLVNAGVKTGQFTTYGTPVARIADIAFVYADAQLFSEDLSRIKPGTPCVVEPQGAKGRSYRAKVSHVYPVLKEGTRYGLARIALENQDLSLKPGMYADVRLELPDDGMGLTVPRDAVIDNGDESWVFVKLDALHFQKRMVRMAEPRGDMISVVRGLEEGEEVATGGAVFFLNAELAMKQPTAQSTNQIQ
jgi:membrane fusion protein, copper/silver efflux system